MSAPRKLSKAEIARAYSEVFATPAGRVVLEDLLKFGHFAEQIHGSGDPYETTFRDGKRRVVLRILSFVKLGPVEAFELARDHSQQQQEQARVDD